MTSDELIEKAEKPNGNEVMIACSLLAIAKMMKEERDERRAKEETSTIAKEALHEMIRVSLRSDIQMTEGFMKAADKLKTLL